jgi:holo-[acyl-carrier protein] synthase
LRASASALRDGFFASPSSRAFAGIGCRPAFLAKRFAAKEAFTKALGTGIHAPANWHGVWVVNLRSGKPELQFTPALKDLLEQRRIRRAHLSLTDERALAAATVILECDAG